MCVSECWLLVVVVVAQKVLFADDNERRLQRRTEASHLRTDRRRRQVRQLGHVEQRLTGSQHHYAHISLVEQLAQLVSVRQEEAEHVAGATHCVRVHLVGGEHRYAVGFRVLLIEILESEIVADVRRYRSDLAARVLVQLRQGRSGKRATTWYVFV